MTAQLAPIALAGILTGLLIGGVVLIAALAIAILRAFRHLLPLTATSRKTVPVLTPFHVIQAADRRQRLTIADLRTFLDEAESAGVPDDARPRVSSNWHGGITRLEIRRPSGGASIPQQVRL